MLPLQDDLSDSAAREEVERMLALARPALAAFLPEESIQRVGDGHPDAADLALFVSNVADNDDVGAIGLSPYAVFDIAFCLGFSCAVRLTRDAFADVSEFIRDAQLAAKEARVSFGRTS